MKISKYLTPLLITFAITIAQSSLAQNSKPDLNQKLTLQTKPAVVRIVSICKGRYKWYPGNEDSEKKQDPEDTFIFDHLGFIGTGFLIDPDGYIVTSSKIIRSKNDCDQIFNRNVKEKIKKKMILYPELFEDKYKNNYDLLDDYLKDHGEAYNRKYGRENGILQSGVYLPHSQGNPVLFENRKPFEVIESGRNIGQEVKINKDVAIIKVSFPKVIAPALKLTNSNKVDFQNEIIAVGYPNIADAPGQDLYLTEKSYLEASVQAGRISNPNKEFEGGYPFFQVDINVAAGSAGSPLINNDGEVVGMLTYNDSDRDSFDDNGEGIPIAIPTSTIQEFIRKSGASNNIGNTSQLYDEGLKLYWKGKYKEAKAKFVKVTGLFPFHSEAEGLIGEIDQKEADWWAKPWTNPANVLLMGLLVGGSIVAGVAYFFLWRKTNLQQAVAGAPSISTQGDSVFVPNFQSNGVGKHSFLELEYKGQIQTYQLDQEELCLGRDPSWSDFNIPISWEVVSRKHAVLRQEREDYRIYDGDGQVPSRNGLWIDDDTRVDHQDGYPLEHGNKLKIGQNPEDQISLTYYNPNSNQANPKTTRMAE